MADRRSKQVLGLFLISAMVVLGLSLYTGFSLNSFVDSLEESRSERLLSEAQASSLILSPAELDAIQDVEALSSEQGLAVIRRLDAFSALHNLTEVAFIRKLPSGQLQYVVSSGAGAGVHDISAPSFSSHSALDAAFDGLVVVTALFEPEALDGGFKSFSPFYDNNGNVIAVVAVGVNDEDILQTNTKIRDLNIILLICIFVVILAACANVLLQVRKEQELVDSIHAQKMMVKISQTLSSEQPFDTRVTESLAALGHFLEASRVYVVSAPDRKSNAYLKHYWSGTGDAPELKDDEINALCKAMCKTVSTHPAKKRLAIKCPNINEPPCSTYKDLLDSRSQAFIWTPLYMQNEPWGLLALEYPKSFKQFEQKDVQLIESVAIDLVAALTREHYGEQREQALNHAVNASEAKSEFLSNVSHEMRTPMNAIIGMTSIALSSDNNERKDYCLEHIKDASEHLLDIINDILDMASIQANELNLRLMPFDLRRDLNWVIKESRFKLSEKQLNFSYYLDEQIPAVLVGDSQRLTRIVTCLLSNAIKFTPNGGSISLRVESLGAGVEGHSLKFVIKDSGI
ncbi:MAG: GAF domain-containing protein, partial [Coriobacteriales bacterium]|nr:GAF domain-containing protein [Coriobacteriales bacterium]